MSDFKKLGIHYQTDNIINDLTTFTMDLIDKTKEELVIVNIGTDRIILDSLAPLVGTLLKNYDTHFYTYGTISEPIHAMNLESKYKKIKEEHPNAFIIGIDASLGNIENVGEIMIRQKSINPGKGVGKKLQEVGDISIIGIVDDCENNELITNRNIRLSFIYDMATVITKVILELDKQIHNKLKYTFIHNNDQIALTI